MMSERFKLLPGDCREQMKTLDNASVDSIVTDPPYELGFMGKGWDRSGIAYDVSVWTECLRVLRPGGHLLAFGGSRTYHRLACAIEDAGFEIRDQIQWIYGSGFPKSLDVSKAIDAAAGVEREAVGMARVGVNSSARLDKSNFMETPPEASKWQAVTAPTSDEAKQWNGWGTALKPAHEPIALARKPVVGTIANNVLQFGAGGLNIDPCRVGDELITAHGGGVNVEGRTYGNGVGIPAIESGSNPHVGRFPANVIHDGSDEVLAAFPDTTSGSKDLVQNGWGGNGIYGQGQPHRKTREGDSGSAARFFYCAKASQEDRNEGLADLPILSAGDVTDRVDGSAGLNSPRAGAGRTNGSRNPHPTVKPTDLMRYLCRLVTPPNGVVLDVFAGSGSTGKAAMLESLRFIGIELDPEYCKLAQLRIEAALKQLRLF